MGDTGECPMCKARGVKLTEHHVIEAPMKHWLESGKAPSPLFLSGASSRMPQTSRFPSSHSG